MSDYTVVNPATGETLADLPPHDGCRARAGARGARTRPPRAGRTPPASPSAPRSCAASPSCTASAATSSPRSSCARWASRSPPRSARSTSPPTSPSTTPTTPRRSWPTSRSTSCGEGTAVIRRSPLGVLLGIMPWNFPYYQVARFAAPNLVIGNTILLKHAPQCPESAAAIETIYRDAGLPRRRLHEPLRDERPGGGGHRRPARAGRLGHRFRACRRGRGRDRRAQPQEGRARARRIRPVHPAVDRRPRRRRAGGGRGAPGQHRPGVQRAPSGSSSPTTCTTRSSRSSPQRMAAAKVGDPFADDTVLGPLSSVARRGTPAGAGRPGGRAGRDARRPAAARDGAFFPRDGAHRCHARHGRVPRGVLRPGRRSSTASPTRTRRSTLANDTPFGLGSYVFTTDAEQAERVADKIDAGMVYVNVVLADAPELPFGGVKR